MGKKKRGSSGRREVKRVDAQDKASSKSKVEAPPAEESKPRMPERIREKDAGFGVIKIVAGVILVLIVGSMILFNQAGGRESARGDKIAGESCAETLECAPGSICYSYKGTEKRCMKRCSKNNPCEPGHTCVSAAQQKRRKGLRVTDICVEDGKI